jgi:hypothetical protein
MTARPLLPLGARVEVCGAQVEPEHPRGAWTWEVGELEAGALVLWPVPRRRPDLSARPPVRVPLPRAVALGLVELPEDAPPVPVLEAAAELEGAAPAEPEGAPWPTLAPSVAAPPAAPTAPESPPAPAPVSAPAPAPAPAHGAAGGAGGLAVAWFEGIDPHPAGGAVLSWERLRARLTDCRTLPAGADKRGAPGWAPVAWGEGKPHRRAAENVGALSCLVLDFDALPPGGLAVLEAAAERLGRAACWHTSWSHAPEHPKARLVLPFDRPCPASQWARVWGAGARWAAGEGLAPDRACSDAGRWYLLPGLPEDAAPERWEACAAGMVEGAPLSWIWFAAAYPPPPPEPPTAPPPRERTRTAGEWADRGRRRALAWFEHRAGALAVMPPGGQSMACYGNARKVGQAVAGGVLGDGEGEDWCRTFTAAGVAAGLPEARAADSVARGYRKGLGEPWDFLGPEPAD